MSNIFAMPTGILYFNELESAACESGEVSL